MEECLHAPYFVTSVRNFKLYVCEFYTKLSYRIANIIGINLNTYFHSETGEIITPSKFTTHGYNAIILCLGIKFNYP
jgi:hypothetical protein